ncbi:hypothetical protein [Roseateles sp. LKC17W]|uniref:LysR substrate-binding domain-containing protein n=1 Tax=Pelomonas margarita TaxID=3299031 RepID=A0ABW7FPL3_9BURK
MELWPEHVPLGAGYQLIQSKRGKRSPGARALAQWLIDEAEAKQAPAYRRSGAP